MPIPRLTRYEKLIPVSCVKGRKYTRRDGRVVQHWEARWTIAGVQETKGLGTDRKDAVRRAHDLYERINFGHLDNNPAIHPTTLAQAGQEWLDHLKATRKSQKWIMTARCILKSVQDGLWKDTLVTDVTIESVSRYLGGLHEPPRSLSNDSINGHRSLIATLFEWLRKRGRVHINPVADFDRLPSNRASGTAREAYLEDDQLRRILAAAKADSDYRAYPLIMLLLHTGLRRAEIQYLTLDDIHLENPNDPHLLVYPRSQRMLKNRAAYTRDIPLHPDVIEPLKTLMARAAEVVHPAMPTRWLLPGDVWRTRRDEPVHYSTITSTVHRIGRLAGVPRCCPHMFRHTLQTKLGLSDIAQEVGMQLADHSNRTVNDLYRMHRSKHIPRTAILALLRAIKIQPSPESNVPTPC